MKKYIIIFVISIFSILTIAGGIIFYRYYAAGAILMYSFFDSQDRAALEVKPTKRSLDEVLETKGTYFEAYGYSMQLPWFQDLKKKVYETNSAIMFGGNLVVSVTNPDLNVNVYTYYSKPYNNSKIESLKAYFDINEFKSNFEFVKSSLNASSDDYSIFTLYKDVAPLFFLLMNKLQYVWIGTYDAKRIYFFQTPNCKAFQTGDPAHTKSIVLHLFADDHQELEVLIVANDFGKVTQKDLDYIIANFKKAS